MTTITWILIIIAIYIVSVLLWLFTTYILDRKSNNTVGDLIDNTGSIAFIPILNTLFYPMALLILILSIIGDLISSSKFWNKIRNIKI